MVKNAMMETYTWNFIFFAWIRMELIFKMNKKLMNVPISSSLKKLNKKEKGVVGLLFRALRVREYTYAWDH